MAERPSACSSCGKRLSRKSWYYRNGQFFCRKSCWQKAKGKAAEAGAKEETQAPATAPAAPAS